MFPHILNTTDANGARITYGFDQDFPWIERRTGHDRYMLIGNCEQNLVRIREEVANRSIRVSEAFKELIGGGVPSLLPGIPENILSW